MKIVANLLLVVCLAAGALSAATAYHVPIEQADDLALRKTPFVLNANAGVVILPNDRLLKLAKQAQQVSIDRRTSAAMPSIFNPPLPPIESMAGMRDGLQYRALVRTNAKQLATAQWDQSSGLVLDNKGNRIPLVHKGDVLTGSILKSLRIYNEETKDAHFRVRYLRGKEFSIARWPGSWVFLASVLGLVGCAVLLLSASKKALARADEKGVAEGPEEALRNSLREVNLLLSMLRDKPDLHEMYEKLAEGLGGEHIPHIEHWAESRSTLITQLGPGGFAELDVALASPSPSNPRLEAIRERLDEAQHDQIQRYSAARLALLARLEGEPNPQWKFWLMDFGFQVLERLGDVQRVHFPAFVEARPKLIARFGMAGFAEIMDSFASAERMLNRAWSAAADAIMEESVASLTAGATLLEDTIRNLETKGGAHS